MSRLILSVLTGALICFVTGSASADKIKTLSKRLASGGTDKVRISAALSLAKSSDDRAVVALSRSLAADKSSAIRRISAASLGQRLRDKVGTNARKTALRALTKASEKDRDSKVRSSAKVALAKAGMGQTPTSGRTRARGVLVNVVTPKNLSKRLPKRTASMMQNTVKTIIREKAPKFVKTAPGTGMPSDSQLKKSGMAGFSVEPKLSKLKLLRSGRRVTVQCEVKMQVLPWATAGQNLAINNTATVTGSGSVTSSSSKGAIADSSQACISAVVTQVTSNQIVPFLAAKAR
jgi:hypothetical protein